eukprot:gene8923-biopygen21188
MFSGSMCKKPGVCILLSSSPDQFGPLHYSNGKVDAHKEAHGSFHLRDFPALLCARPPSGRIGFARVAASCLPAHWLPTRPLSGRVGFATLPIHFLVGLGSLCVAAPSCPYPPGLGLRQACLKKKGAAGASLPRLAAKCAAEWRQRPPAAAIVRLERGGSLSSRRKVCGASHFLPHSGAASGRAMHLPGARVRPREQRHMEAVIVPRLWCTTALARRCPPPPHTFL